MVGRVRIGEVWDSTLDAARGRAGVIAPIALGAFFVPGVVQNAVGAFGGAGAGPLMLLVVLATVVLTLWGQLAIVAVVSDPSTTRGDASRQATARLGPALGNAALLVAVVLAVVLPLLVALATSGIDWAAMQAARPGTRVPLGQMSPGARTFASFYLFGFILFSFWLGARAMLVSAVVLNERQGPRAVPRALALTRGLTWKLIGVTLLYAVVLLIAMIAIQTAVLVPARLLLHPGGALFLAVTAGGLVSTALVTLFCIFTGRLYVAAAGVDPKG